MKIETIRYEFYHNSLKNGGLNTKTMPKKRKKLSDFMKKYYETLNHTDAEWKDIMLGDFPMYEISNYGEIRRKDNKLQINPFHSYRKDQNGKFIYDRPTYLRVQLYYYENGVRKKKHFEVSRLVAHYFIPIPQEYLNSGYTEDSLEVNHIHGGYNIYDNTIDNLEWCTQQENITKSIETELRHPPKGSKHHATYIDENIARKICECIENGCNAKSTYKVLNIATVVDFSRFKNLFYAIKYHYSWNYISCDFNF